MRLPFRLGLRGELLLMLVATMAVVVRPSAAMAALCRFQASELSTESPLGKSFFTNSATAAWRFSRSSGVVWR